MKKYQSLQSIQTAIQSQQATLEEVVTHYLGNINQYNNKLHVFVEVYREEALEKAKALDKKYQTAPKSVGKLFGLVISIKDVLSHKDHIVSASSKMLEKFTAVYNATAVERLLAEDAIIIGRTNCDEFAMGSTNETSYFGVTRNAADPDRAPGGSSGGAAVSVQANMCLAALGSDTGGSVRQPAAWCGVIGLKPTYGRISRHGLLAYASSFDQIGIFTNSLEDAAQILEVTAGHDEFDATVASIPVPNYSNSLDIKKGKAKIAYFESTLNGEGLDQDIHASTSKVIERLKAAGHEVEAVPFEYLDYLVPTYYVLTTAEASSNLSRYDGVRYGHRAENVNNLKELYQKSRTEGFGKEVKKRIMLGTFVLSVGYYDAYYTKAQQVRRLLSERTKAIFEQYDFILMPTTPNVAPKIGESEKDPIATYLADIYTVFANLIGAPAISLPIQNVNNESLPIGIQFIGKDFEEAQLLSFSKEIEQLL